MSDELPEYDPAVFAGGSWMRNEIDRSVLEKLIEMAEERTLKSKILGKPTRKKFGIRKYRKFEIL